MKAAFILIPVFLLCAYLLYENGFMVFQSKRAVFYMGSRRGNKASFSSCTGQSKRIVRFPESKSYQFQFDCQLTKGEVSVELLDSSKERILFLKSGQKQGTAALERGKRYVLIFRFQNATGSYLLEWT